MAQLDRLIRDARKSMKARGHIPMQAQRSCRCVKSNCTCNTKRSTATIECAKCSMSVQVICKPLPNEIDIGGEAVALNCNVTTKPKPKGLVMDKGGIRWVDEPSMHAVMGC